MEEDKRCRNDGTLEREDAIAGGATSADTGRGESRRPSRRAFLRAGGVSLAVLSAGCQRGTETDSPDRSPPPTPTEDVAGSPGASATRTPGTTGETNGRGPSPSETTAPDADIYVAPDGRPKGPGTRSAPLANLSTALERAEWGTTVRLRGGTYRHDRTVGARELSGAPDAPVVVEAEPGERPVFDFGRASTGGLRFSDCHWLEIRGLTVLNAPSRGLFIDEGSEDVLVEDVSVRESGGDPNASGTGVFVQDSRRVTLRRIDSRNNYDPSSGGGNADGIDVEGSPGSTVEACVARGNSDDGIDLWQSTGVTVRGCWAYGNGYDPDGNAAGNGDGFKLGGGDDSGDSVVQRCVAFDNRVRGFDDNGATRPLTLYNCTAWRNPVDYRLGCHIDGADTVCPPHVLRNNLSVGGDVHLSPFVDSETNSWQLGIADPEFASTDPSDADFLRLTEDSPAVDAGVDVGLSYAGDAPDLGAFEYGADRASATPADARLSAAGVAESVPGGDVTTATGGELGGVGVLLGAVGRRALSSVRPGSD